MKITDIRALEDIAKEIRIKILKMLAAGSVHTGGSLSAVDMDTLYTPGKINSFLQYYPCCESVPGGIEISTDSAGHGLEPDKTCRVLLKYKR